MEKLPENLFLFIHSLHSSRDDGTLMSDFTKKELKKREAFQSGVAQVARNLGRTPTRSNGHRAEEPHDPSNHNGIGLNDKRLCLINQSLHWPTPPSTTIAQQIPYPNGTAATFRKQYRKVQSLGLS